MTDTVQVSYALRQQMIRAGLPFQVTWDKQGLYLGAWLQARKAGKQISVTEACKAAGFSTDALRQRRKHSSTFAAAEAWARRGVPYEPHGEPATKPHDVVTDPLVTDVTFRRDPGPIVRDPLGVPATGPTNTTLAPKPPGVKRKPTRRYLPAWVPGSGYEKF